MSLKKDLIIFDLDGTLIDSSGDIAWAVNATLKALGHREMDTDEIKANIGWGVRSLFEKILPCEPKTKIDEARGIFLAHYDRHLLIETRLYRGAKTTLWYFHKNGRKLAIVTNKPMGLAERILDGLSIRRFFQTIVGGDSIANKKPHPEPIILAMKTCGVIPDRTVLVGDSAIDCEAGAMAGITTIGAGYGFRGRAELKKYGCDFIINSIGELKDIIR